MKVVLPIFLLLLSATSLFAQQKSTEWERVYTFDESVIEMNTAKAVFGGDIARVRFRWTFDQPEVLSGPSPLSYQSKLEYVEINCADKRYRPLEVTLLDSAGNRVSHEELNPLGEWWKTSGLMMSRLVDSACALKESETHPRGPSSEEIELQKVAQYVYSLWQQLEQTKDIKPIVEKFFVRDYVNRYLSDQKSNWFWNLNRETAAKASRTELERFYVAVLNAGYLGTLYFTNESAHAADLALPDETMIPGDLREFIDGHPYTAKYKGNQITYNYLAEKIDSVERMRSYTELLEGVSGLLRRHVTSIATKQPEQYQAMLEDWGLSEPKTRTCATECLGLPRGTKLFEVDVPVFHLQLAKIKGRLRVVSATDLSY